MENNAKNFFQAISPLASLLIYNNCSREQFLPSDGGPDGGSRKNLKGWKKGITHTYSIIMYIKIHPQNKLLSPRAPIYQKTGWWKRRMAF